VALNRKYGRTAERSACGEDRTIPPFVAAPFGVVRIKPDPEEVKVSKNRFASFSKRPIATTTVA
jgi:hypothetical protein